MIYNIRFYKNKEGYIVFDDGFTKLESKEVVMIRFKLYLNAYAGFIVYSACGLIHEFPLKVFYTKSGYTKSRMNLSLEKIKEIINLYDFCKKHKIDIKFYMSSEWKEI
jgi:hypothetical protein